jgi:nitrite reductase (NADH) small subunit
MSMIKTLIFGRPEGIRQKLFALLSKRQATPAGGTSTAPPPRTPPAPAYEPAEKALKLKKEAPRDVTPPEGYEVVLHKDALEKGKIVEVIVAGTAIAVANVDGKFCAIANACKHAGGPLGEGTLEGAIVTCPYHGWQYSVEDGSCKTNTKVSVQVFPVEVVGDAVCVRL